MPASTPLDSYLANTGYFDFEHPLVLRFIEQSLQGIPDEPIAQAKALYLQTRDAVAYNPYVFSTQAHSFSASHILESGSSYCIPKAVLLGAAARAVGIPSRLGLADVKNHISSPQLIAYLRSDIFRMHGYIELYLNGRWVKATPAFDAALCQRMDIAALPFDGVQDSIFQEFSASGQHCMEYINDHGHYADVPLDFIVGQIRTHYAHLFNAEGRIRPTSSASLAGDIS